MTVLPRTVRRTGCALLAAALLVPAGPAIAADAPPSTAENRTVTLLTGDRVTLTQVGDGPAQVAFQPGPGRDGMPFLQRTENGRVSVVPFDAVRLIETGAVDKALFDVTTLLETSSTDLPLIVSYRTAAAGRARLRSAPARVVRELPSVNGAAVAVPTAQAGSFWKTLNPAAPEQAGALADGLAEVSLDGLAKPLDAGSNEQIRVDRAWRRGLTGTGVTVAVLDSGYDPDHPDLAGLVTGTKDFTNSAAGMRDEVGHGTHVATTIAGSAAASRGKVRGVAPGAKLLIGKVCVVSGCPNSAIIAGMEWAAAAGAKVVNLSLGGGPTDGTDPLAAAVNTLTARYGTLFVIAAGNLGADRSVTSPGSATAALTVGAVTRDDDLASFSSRGPRVGDHAIKPELTAPGYAILAGRAAGTSMGYPVDEHYTLSNGTSMASPHVAGAAAILAGQHPAWSAAELKAALVGSAEPQPGSSVFGQGAGRLDVGRAIDQDVVAEPATLTVGAGAGTLTYRNNGRHAVSLRLDATPRVGLSRERLTVPAGGTAQVTVSARATGAYGALVTARGGHGIVVQTPVSAYADPPTQQVSVSTVNRAGVTNGTDFGFTVYLANLDSGTVYGGLTYGRPLAGALPKGRYAVFSWIPTAEPGKPRWQPSMSLVAAELVVDGPRELTLDARTAIRVGATLNGVEAPDGSVSGTALGLAGTGRVYAAQHAEAYVAPARVGGTVYTSSQYLREMAGSMACGPGTNAVCNVGLASTGGPVVTHPAITDADLATVTADLGAPGAEGKADRIDYAVVPGSASPPAEPIRPDEAALPGRLTSYFYSAGGVQWSSVLMQTVPSVKQLQNQSARPIPNGSVSAETWYRGVIGPAVGSGSVRTGNLLTVSVPLMSDGSAGHFASSAWTGSTGRTVLWRDGKLSMGVLRPDAAGFQVPAGRHRYQLLSTATRTGNWTDLSTRVEASWGFESRHSTTPAALPLLSVRVNPALDGLGATAAGTSLTIPLRVEGTATTRRIRDLRLRVSYDDGATWRSVPVDRRDATGRATVRHPALADTSGYVSLRVTASDTAGNTVEQTVIHAYRLR